MRRDLLPPWGYNARHSKVAAPARAGFTDFSNADSATCPEGETHGSAYSLYDQHLALGAKMVDFGGWDMPLHYGSQVEEHHQVRRDCGVFDVSHMTVVDVAGDQASAYLQHLLANDVARLKSPGRALYSAMLNERGGVIDDLIVYLTDRLPPGG